MASWDTTLFHSESKRSFSEYPADSAHVLTTVDSFHNCIPKRYKHILYTLAHIQTTNQQL